MTMLDTDDLMSAAEVAKLAGIERSTLSTYVLRGHGPDTTPVAGRNLFLRADVEAWMAQRPGQGTRTDLA